MGRMGSWGRGQWDTYSESRKKECLVGELKPTGGVEGPVKEQIRTVKLPCKLIKLLA